jgi:hypothetical protein
MLYKEIFTIFELSSNLKDKIINLKLHPPPSKPCAAKPSCCVNSKLTFPDEKVNPFQFRAPAPVGRRPEASSNSSQPPESEPKTETNKAAAERNRRKAEIQKKEAATR